MADLTHLDPLRRFSGLADLYAQCRPDYPAAAIDFIIKHCGLRPGSLLADIGSGTGISARLFACRGLRVIGIEPNADMRRRAEAEPVPAACLPPQYCHGQAEATGLPSGGTDAVLAAQAFHWFQPEAALREFHRLLKPGGWTVLLWNERDERDPFTAAYGLVIRNFPDAAVVEGPRGKAGGALLDHPLFDQPYRALFPHEQELTEDQAVGRALSASYAPRQPAAVACCEQQLRTVFARFQSAGRARLRYETRVFTARRRP